MIEDCKTKNSEDKLTLMVHDVIAKKELSNLDESFVRQKVEKFLLYNKSVAEKLKQSKKYSEFRRSKEHDTLLKAVRADLRGIYGVFIMEDSKHRKQLLEELKKNPSVENHNKILELHKSSKERLPYYSMVYKKIFEVTGKPTQIIDLACGLNPFSYPYLGCKPTYFACDLSGIDMKFVQEYFKFMCIPGDANALDLVKDDLSSLCSSLCSPEQLNDNNNKNNNNDSSNNQNRVVFLFKTLDSLETTKKGSSRQLLERLKAEFIVVSFSTQSLGGGKPIPRKKRAWFEKLLPKQGYKYSVFEIPCELFYILYK